MITIAAFDREGGVARLQREADEVMRSAGRPFAHGLVGPDLPDAYLRVDLESRHVTASGEIAFADFRTQRAKEPPGCPRSLCRRIVAMVESRGLLPLLRFEQGFLPLLHAVDRRRLAVSEGRMAPPRQLSIALAAGEDHACFLASHPQRAALVGRIECVLEIVQPTLSLFVGTGARVSPDVTEGRVAFLAEDLPPDLDLHIASATLLSALLFGLDAPAPCPGALEPTEEPALRHARDLLGGPFVEYYAARVGRRAGSPSTPSPG